MVLGSTSVKAARKMKLTPWVLNFVLAKNGAVNQGKIIFFKANSLLQ